MNVDLELRNIIIDTLCNVGVYIEEEITNNDKDINITDYLNSSLMFIAFIVDLEDRFGIEFPDDLLTADTLSSLNGFVSLVQLLINNGERRDPND